MRYLLIHLLLVLSFLTSSAVAKVELRAEKTAEAEAETVAKISPRARVRNLLAVISGESAQPLADNFDTRDTKFLKYVRTNSVVVAFPDLLDRYGSLIPIGLISDEPNGSEEVGLKANFEKVGEIDIQGEQYPILLELIEKKDGEKQWLVSQQTIYDLFALVDYVDESLINQVLPAFLIDHKWRGAPIGQWLGVFLLGAICFAIGWVISAVLSHFVSKYNDSHPGSRRGQVLKALSIPLGIILAIILFLGIIRFLEVSIIIRQDFSVLTLTAVWLAIFSFAWSLVDNVTAHGEDVFRQKNKVSSLSLIIFFRATAKAVIICLAFMMILTSNGIDVTTGLAALGIGGIALALGAQKAIENLVGSIIIILDQPIRVGDFIQVGTMLGTVEGIGLRSTRIRTLSDTIVTFPNGTLSSERIENYTLRRRFLIRTKLNLRYETKTDDIKAITSGMRDYLTDHQRVSDESMRVVFVGYGAASLDIEVMCYVYAEDYTAFLYCQEDILLGLTEIVENNNSGFAYPSQTLYLAKDSGPKAS